jgi:hypothetical protein
MRAVELRLDRTVAAGHGRDDVAAVAATGGTRCPPAQVSCLSAGRGGWRAAAESARPASRRRC